MDRARVAKLMRRIRADYDTRRGITQSSDTGAEVMGLTDAKTWDEAAVFVIAELGSLKKRIKELEGLEAAPTNGERRLAVLEDARLATKVERVSDDVEEINKRLEDLANYRAKAHDSVCRRISRIELKLQAQLVEPSLSTPTQPTETSQCGGCKDPNCSNKAKVEEQKQTEAGQVAALQKMLAESEARTTEKLVELHEADLVNKALEARVLELESLARKEVGSTDNAWRRVTELEVERNLAKARISAITDKLRSLVTQLRVQNTTAPHWRSDTAVGAYRHSANLLETALIELALVAAPADSAHVAKEHAEGLARMLEAGTSAQTDTQATPVLLMRKSPDDAFNFAYGVAQGDPQYAHVYRASDGKWLACWDDGVSRVTTHDTLHAAMRDLNQRTGRNYQIPA